MSGQLHAPTALTPGKEPPVPTEQELEINGCGTLFQGGWFVTSEL